MSSRDAGKLSPTLGLAGLAVAVPLLLVLSGCVGDSGDAVVKSSGPPPKPSTKATDDANCPGCLDVDEGKLSPRRHHHHYWGDLTEVVVFEGLVTLKPHVASGSLALEDVTNNFDEGCNSVGHAQWDLEDDGDDVGGDQISPIHPDNRRADTVFAGTDSLKVELLSFDQTILGLGFKYKPGNLNFFLPTANEDNSGACGIMLVKDRPFTIPVGPGQADPPHQYFASRWEFQAFSLYREGQADAPSAGQGQFKIRITAHNGGENNLDPAHPDLFGTGEMYELGCAEGEATHQVIAPPLLRPRGVLTDIKWPDGRIVPLLTERVVATLTVENSAAVPQTTVELWFHGSNTTKYSKATEKVTIDDKTTVYTIPDPSQILADPPYEYKTLWRFELRPVGPQGEPLTEFNGKYQLCAVAHKIPGAILT